MKHLWIYCLFKGPLLLIAFRDVPYELLITAINKYLCKGINAVEQEFNSLSLFLLLHQWCYLCKRALKNVFLCFKF